MSKPTIQIDFRGAQGNIFYILSSACSALRHSALRSPVVWKLKQLKYIEMERLCEDMKTRVTNAESYQEALNIIEEYVTIKPKGGLPMK